MIDLDLAAHVDGPSTGSPDELDTPTFMPLQVLEYTDETLVHHQELHEDESVLWIGFLALICRSASGYSYIKDNLGTPYISLSDLDSRKWRMLAPSSQKLRWPSWLSVSSDTQDQPSPILRGLCSRTVWIQFTSGAGMSGDTYPDVREVDGRTGRRKQETQHVRVFAELVKGLGKAIDELVEL